MTDAKSRTHTVRLKRAYDEVAKADGFRILVDRIWPRGVSKDKAQIDEWVKEVGPSTDLRKWFGHDPDKFDEFARKYKQELSGSDAWKDLQSLVADHSTVTLVYSAKDEKHNQAVVLKDLLT